jgi:hypothetical protein
MEGFPSAEMARLRSKDGLRKAIVDSIISSCCRGLFYCIVEGTLDAQLKQLLMSKGYKVQERINRERFNNLETIIAWA